MSRIAIAQPSADTIAATDRAFRTYREIGARHGEAIWPRFRPDTIPLLFNFPGRGQLLYGWGSTLPNGFAAVSGSAGAWRVERSLGAASTAVELGGRRVAQVAASSLALVDLVPVAVHEAFHVFQNTARTAGRRFGAGENAAFVSSYPIFDHESETSIGLEGRALAAALDAPSPAKRREHALHFLALRRERHRLAGNDVSEFDMLSEMNEGLAEYSLVRTLQLFSSDGDQATRTAAAIRLRETRTQLANLTGNSNLSLRLRYYLTGPAIALLLDQLGGAEWKTRLIAGNWTMQDMLASVSGADDVLARAHARVRQQFDVASARASAQAGITTLRSQRLRLVDSVLSIPGVLLIVQADSLPVRAFNLCGFDPQNHLQVTEQLRVQMRWWRPCAGGPTYVEFNVPSVHDAAAGALRAVIGPGHELKAAAQGTALEIQPGVRLSNIRALKLTAPKATVDAARADILLRNDTLFVWPKPPS